MPDQQEAPSSRQSAEDEDWEEIGVCRAASREAGAQTHVWSHGTAVPQYFTKALGLPGKTGDNLIILLERRLDNVVYRLHFATSRAQARQLVNHGHIAVNGKRVDVASYLVKPGDMISVVGVAKKWIQFAMHSKKCRGPALCRGLRSMSMK